MEKLVQQVLAYLNTIPRPKNWVLKLISFFFALFLWYFVAGEDKVDMTVMIPIEIVNLPRGMVISNQFKKQLEVTVSGQRSMIRGLSTQHITRTVDLSHAEPGKVVINNKPDSVPFPWGISVLRLQPTNVTLLIDRLIEKELKIEPTVTGSPPDGFKFVTVTLEPAVINITGPKSVLDEEQYLHTHLIDITNLRGNTVKQVSLDLKPEINELLGETVVTANIFIVEKKLEQQISNIPLEFAKNGDEKYLLPPTKVDLQAEIPITLIKDTKDLRTIFHAFVDPNVVSPGQNEFIVKIKIADYAAKFKDQIRIIDFSPKTVPLRIIEEKRPVIEPERVKIRVNEIRQDSSLKSLSMIENTKLVRLHNSDLDQEKEQ